MRKAVRLGVALVFLAAIASGCAETSRTVQRNPKTTIGAGAGAVGGAVIGGLVGGKRGAVVGGLLGALTGGVVGHYLDEQERGRAETNRQYGYSPAEGTRLRIEKVRANPAVLDPGETVNIHVTYAVLTPRPEAQVLVKETREILVNGTRVGETSIEITREGGTWRSTVPVTLPANAAPGSYRIVASVETRGGGKDIEETHFKVRRN